jgi:hypothetical protein
MSKHVKALRGIADVLERDPIGGNQVPADAIREIADHLERKEAELRIARKALEHYAAKEATTDINAIRARVDAGESQRAVARDLGISISYVNRLLTGDAKAPDRTATEALKQMRKVGK